MAIDATHKLDHCRGELGRQAVERCPKLWLIAARKLARESGDLDMAQACTIALAIRRGELRNVSANTVPMAKLTGRKSVR
jgi:hypothetical protein